MKYYHLYGDSDNTCFYYNKDDKIHVDYCHECGKVINRQEAILQATELYKNTHKRLLSVTWDGVYIASQRFVDIYNRYNMKGLFFTSLPKSLGSYRVDCSSVVRHDTTINPNIVLEKMCTSCGRRNGAYRPTPYKIVAEDEALMKPFHFYRSDLEFGDKHTQSYLFYVSESVMEVFRTEGGRIFFETVIDGKRVFIDCKQHII